MIRIILLIIGTVSLVLGSLGIVVPLLPTTPFLLLSLACFLKSSDRMYNFVLTNKYLAPYVKDFMEGRGIPKDVKKKAIFFKWLGIGFAVFFVVEKNIIKGLLLVISSIVSVYILTRKTADVYSQNQPY